MLSHFHKRWREIPLVVIDTETTGVIPGVDGVVQLGLARFEDGKCVASNAWLVNPGRQIPAGATAIHGITDEMVAGSLRIEAGLAHEETAALLSGARAAGELFFKIADANDRLIPPHLGDALKWFELQRAEEWHRFNDWRARQPPQETT